jgi:hypothetical protein
MALCIAAAINFSNISVYSYTKILLQQENPSPLNIQELAVASYPVLLVY